VWPQVAKPLTNARVLTGLDAIALGAFCETFARWREACDSLAKHGVLARTERGGVKLSPLWLAYIQSSAEMRRMLIEFGMTPSARARARYSAAWFCDFADIDVRDDLESVRALRSSRDFLDALRLRDLLCCRDEVACVTRFVARLDERHVGEAPERCRLRFAVEAIAQLPCARAACAMYRHRPMPSNSRYGFCFALALWTLRSLSRCCGIPVYPSLVNRSDQVAIGPGVGTPLVLSTWSAGAIAPDVPSGATPCDHQS